MLFILFILIITNAYADDISYELDNQNAVIEVIKKPADINEKSQKIKELRDNAIWHQEVANERNKEADRLQIQLIDAQALEATIVNQTNEENPIIP